MAPSSAMTSSISLSSLIARRAHHEAVELFGHLDLAGKTRVRPQLKGKVKLVLLLGRGRRQLVLPGFVDIDVAGRAGARAAAFGDDARDAVPDRGLHHGPTNLGIDGVNTAIMFDEGDCWHV